MALMSSEVYDAFVSAGAPEDKARKAAEAIANFDNRFTKIDGEIAVLKWMTGFGLAVSIAILTKLFAG
ncbi:MAG: integrase [Hyphomicrobiales bacterium]|nr:integrase [Hyphomicrobiales bacterium]